MITMLKQGLANAASDALQAPSIWNTQPWTWRISAYDLELNVDRDRQLNVADPQGRLLILSCGIALHHARISLAAQGYRPRVRRLVTSFEDDLIARVGVDQQCEASPEVMQLYAAIARRHTDRRPFGDAPVPDQLLNRLRDAVEAEGCLLHVLTATQVPTLALAAATAGSTQLADEDYRLELMRWSNRPAWSGDGIPAGATVAAQPRRVPQRILALPPHEGVPVSGGGDHGASYLVVYGPCDRARDWLMAGEATSALMLTATAAGVSVTPISDAIEVPRSRAMVARLLPEPAHPYLILRCGYPIGGPEPDTTPRRSLDEAIDGFIADLPR